MYFNDNTVNCVTIGQSLERTCVKYHSVRIRSCALLLVKKITYFLDSEGLPENEI